MKIVEGLFYTLHIKGNFISSSMEEYTFVKRKGYLFEVDGVRFGIHRLGNKVIVTDRKSCSAVKEVEVPEEMGCNYAEYVADVVKNDSNLMHYLRVYHKSNEYKRLVELCKHMVFYETEMFT